MIVDVSSWQNDIDWNAVKNAGVTFAWIKATEGIGFVDPKFQQNWQAIKQAGIPRGAYHYARPDLGIDNYLAEAKFFVDTVKPEWDDRMAGDFEVGTGNLNNYTYQFLKYIRDTTGVTPFLYTYLNFVAQCLTEPALNEFPLWLADYASSEPTPPPPFNQIALWQYTSSGNVIGIPGRVDLSSPGIYSTDSSGTLEEILEPIVRQWIAETHEAVGRIEHAVGTVDPGGAVQTPNYLGWSRDVTAALADLKAHPAVVADPTLAAKVDTLSKHLGVGVP